MYLYASDEIGLIEIQLVMKSAVSNDNDLRRYTIILPLSISKSASCFSLIVAVVPWAKHYVRWFF